MLVADLADNLFEDVLERDDSRESAVFIRDQSEMAALHLHLPQHLVDAFRPRHPQRRAEQVLQHDQLRIGEQRDDVLGVEHAANAIEIAFVHRHSRVPLFGQQLDDLLGSRIDGDADYVRPRHHDFLRSPGREVEQAVHELGGRGWFLAGARFAGEDLLDLLERRWRRRVARGGALPQEERVEEPQHEPHERLRNGAHDVGGPRQGQAPAERVGHGEGSRSEIEHQREDAGEESGEQLQRGARHRGAGDPRASEDSIHPDGASNRGEGEQSAARGAQRGRRGLRIPLQRQYPANSPRRSL